MNTTPYDIHRKAVCCGEEGGDTRNEDDRIRRGFQSRTEIEEPRIENAAGLHPREACLCALLRKTRKEREKWLSEILYRNSTTRYLYLRLDR